MLRGMTDAISVTIVGAGRLGSALARGLKASGVRIESIVSRDPPKSARLARLVGARAAKLGVEKLESEIVWLCVPDGEILRVARLVAKTWQGQIAFHSSGALTSDELEKFRRMGVKVASVHPLMTFPQGAGVAFAGVPFGLEGDHSALVMARKVVKRLGGIAFTVSKRKKAAYHTWGMFASPLLIALLRSAEDVAGLAGVTKARELILPILLQTVANYVELGAERAFTGPIARGDMETVRKHLRALRPSKSLRMVYLALAASAVERLPAAERRNMRRVLPR